MLPDRKPL
jgi:putative transposase